MIKSITVTNYRGDSLTMELMKPEKSGFIITGIDGISSATGNINMTDVATSDGAVFNSSRIDTRNIVLSLKLLPNPSIEASRHKLYRYFPVKKPLIFRVDSDLRSSQIVGYVESNEVEIFSNQETAQISILCPSPFFEAVRPEKVVFSGIEPLFEFPMEKEISDDDSIVVSEIYQDTVRTVYYSGDQETGVTIDIHAIGPASGITIYNQDTRETMAIDMELEPLDDIIITTHDNHKSARLLRHGVYSSILNKVDKDSDWFTLAKGDNVFSYIATEGQENLQFSITSTVLYEGV